MFPPIKLFDTLDKRGLKKIPEKILTNSVKVCHAPAVWGEHLVSAWQRARLLDLATRSWSLRDFGLAQEARPAEVFAEDRVLQQLRLCGFQAKLNFACAEHGMRGPEQRCAGLLPGTDPDCATAGRKRERIVADDFSRSFNAERNGR